VLDDSVLCTERDDVQTSREISDLILQSLTSQNYSLFFSSHIAWI